MQRQLRGLTVNAIVIEHVALEELPAAWRERLASGPLAGGTGRVTVRIEQEATVASPDESFVSDDPAFGIWRDREDMDDATAYVRKLREPRFRRDGSRNEP